MNVVQTTAALLNSTREGRTWTLQARVVAVRAQVVAERALVGTRLTCTYSGVLLPKLALRTGILFRVGIPLEIVEARLDLIAADLDPFKGAPLVFEARDLGPLNEPCVRVPISVLRELRGQEPSNDSTRRALIYAWSEDRTTGPKN